MSEPARAYLDLAARLALRAAGDVEPNPMVGCVLVKDGRIIGLGHHRKYGGLHAEREALADCRRRCGDPRGATAYVTLEPCCHHGKQPPCTDALIEAGVERVIAARRDPNPVSSGGAAVLAGAGIACCFSDASALSGHISDPFIKRVTTGLPWVLAKWAQTADGRMVTTPDEPRWISGEAARRRVHQIRSRVDAIITGVGTVRADDPMLTVRGVRVHRTPIRVVLDSRFSCPVSSKLVRSARDVQVVVVGASGATGDADDRRASLEQHGAKTEVVAATADGRIDLKSAMRMLADRIGVTTALLESGPRLLGAMFEHDLIDAAVVHAAGLKGAPLQAVERAATVAPALADHARFSLCRPRTRDVDAELTFYRTGGSAIE